MSDLALNEGILSDIRVFIKGYFRETQASRIMSRLHRKVPRKSGVL